MQTTRTYSKCQPITNSSATTFDAVIKSTKADSSSTETLQSDNKSDEVSASTSERESFMTLSSLCNIQHCQSVNKSGIKQRESMTADYFSESSTERVHIISGGTITDSSARTFSQEDCSNSTGEDHDSSVELCRKEDTTQKGQGSLQDQLELDEYYIEKQCDDDELLQRYENITDQKQRLNSTLLNNDEARNINKFNMSKEISTIVGSEETSSEKLDCVSEASYQASDENCKVQKVTPFLQANIGYRKAFKLRSKPVIWLQKTCQKVVGKDISPSRDIANSTSLSRERTEYLQHVTGPNSTFSSDNTPNSEHEMKSVSGRHQLCVETTDKDLTPSEQFDLVKDCLKEYKMTSTPTADGQPLAGTLDLSTIDSDTSSVELYHKRSFFINSDEIADETDDNLDLVSAKLIVNKKSPQRTTNNAYCPLVMPTGQPELKVDCLLTNTSNQKINQSEDGIPNCCIESLPGTLHNKPGLRLVKVHQYSTDIMKVSDGKEIACVQNQISNT